MSNNNDIQIGLAQVVENQGRDQLLQKGRCEDCKKATLKGFMTVKKIVWLAVILIASHLIVAGLCAYKGYTEGEKKEVNEALAKDIARQRNWALLTDSIINNTYSDHLHATPYSTLSEHQQRKVFEIAFEAGLVNILNWIEGSPEVLNPSRKAVLAQRIDDINRGVEIPFARFDGMYFKQKYYDLKQHHENKQHPELNTDIAALIETIQEIPANRQKLYLDYLNELHNQESNGERR